MGSADSRFIVDLYFSDKPLSAVRSRHKHNVYEMLYITEGSLSCEIAGNKIECTAPALVFIGNYEPHIINSCSENYSRYVLSLDPYKAAAKIKPEQLLSVFSLHSVGFSHVLDVSPIALDVKVMLENLYREWRAPESERMPEGDAILLSALLYRIRRFSPRHFTNKKFGSAEMIVSSVRMELECNFSERLNLNRLAESHHVSRYYLAHIFKSVTGYSLKDYQMLCRISYACERLSSPDVSIREVAEAAGFNDMSNFSRTFKEKLGMTPSEFRAHGQSM